MNVLGLQQLRKKSNKICALKKTFWESQNFKSKTETSILFCVHDGLFTRIIKSNENSVIQHGYDGTVQLSYKAANFNLDLECHLPQLINHNCLHYLPVGNLSWKYFLPSFIFSLPYINKCSQAFMPWVARFQEFKHEYRLYWINALMLLLCHNAKSFLL